VNGDDFWERQLRLRGEQVTALQAQLDSAQRAAQEAAVRHEAQVGRLDQYLVYQVTTEHQVLYHTVLPGAARYFTVLDNNND
jgi:hypothetical protein